MGLSSETARCSTSQTPLAIRLESAGLGPQGEGPVTKRRIFLVSLPLVVILTASIPYWVSSQQPARRPTTRGLATPRGRVVHAQAIDPRRDTSWKTIVRRARPLEQWADDLRRQAVEALIEAGEPAYPALAHAWHSPERRVGRKPSTRSPRRETPRCRPCPSFVFDRAVLPPAQGEGRVRTKCR